VESGGPDVFFRVYDRDELLGESPVKRHSRKRISIELRVDYVKADPNPHAGRTAWSVMHEVTRYGGNCNGECGLHYLLSR